MELSELLSRTKQFLGDDLGTFNAQISRVNVLLKELAMIATIPAMEYGPVTEVETALQEAEIELHRVVSDLEDSYNSAILSRHKG